MIRVSDFSSLMFRDYINEDFGEQIEYMQFFAPSDRICVQVYTSFDDIIARLTNLDTNFQEVIKQDLKFESDGIYTTTFTVTGRDTGNYKFEFIQQSSGYIYKASYFQILSGDCLKDSILLRYTNYKNELATFTMRGLQFVFDLRFKGRMLYKDIEFSSDDEMFRDQDYAGHITSSFPYYSMKLTMGDENGVPVWMGQKLLYAFSCSDVKINNKNFVKSPDSDIEKVEIKASNPLAIYKIGIEPSSFYNYDLEPDTLGLVTNLYNPINTNTDKTIILNN